MTRNHFAGFAFAAAFASAATACSENSPTAPQGPGDFSESSARVLPIPGVYQLSFLSHNGQPVASMNVFEELVLKAHVQDPSGNPAQGGSVTFQYCSLNGGPPNDINRADEAPKSECESGAASWSRLWTVSVNSSGDAVMVFGIVRIPRTVGFRFKYASKRTGIADGISAPLDFTWTPAP